MDRTTAAARATRAAESKGHTLGAFGKRDPDEPDWGYEYAACTQCGHEAVVGSVLDEEGNPFPQSHFFGNATLYPCRPSGKRGTLTHNAED